MTEQGRLSRTVLERLIDAARDAVVVVDDRGAIMRWNPAAEQIFGYDEAQALGQDVHRLIAPSEDQDKALEHMLRFRHQDDGDLIDRTTEITAVRRDGARICVELSLTSLTQGIQRHVLAIIRDVTERRRVEEELLRSERNFHNVVEMNRSGILVVDGEGRIRFANSAAQQLLNRSWGELSGKPFGVPSGTLRQEMSVLRKDGTAGTAEMSATQTRWEGGPAHLVMLHDITELKEAESRARFLALHDPLTGLPNRRLFLERLNHALRHAETSGGQAALLFLDLDRFKPINDSLGHLAGDQVLRAFAQRIEQGLRASDTIARLGGDEFAAVLQSVTKLEDVDAVLGKLSQCMQRPIPIGDEELYVGASIGVALYPDHGRDADTLLRRADDAMYSAKRDGGSHVRYFSQSMETGDKTRLDLDRRLHEALEKGEFRLVYQPQVRISDGLLSGCEALLRWHNPALGHVPPDRFIPMLEANGGIRKVGAWVLERACKQIVAWRAQGMDPPPIAVNVSARQLVDKDFPGLVERAIATHQLPPVCLRLELTETALVDDKGATTAALHRLADLGLALHMDDFGTGYSSLGLLRKLPFDTVKIDRSYVARIAENEEDALLVAGVISIAHSLHKVALAEGVETREQLELLRAYNCNFAQGWMCGRPMESDRVEALFQGERRQEALV